MEYPEKRFRVIVTFEDGSTSNDYFNVASAAVACRIARKMANKYVPGVKIKSVKAKLARISNSGMWQG